MYDRDFIRSIVLQVINELNPIDPTAHKKILAGEMESEYCADISKDDLRKLTYLENPCDMDYLVRSKGFTPARLGMGRSGYRYNTKTLLRFLADHAESVDSVFSHVDEALLQSYHLPVIQTLCRDKDEFITRPDLGRQFGKDEIEDLSAMNPDKPQALIYLSDGLSSKAVEANGFDAMQVIMDGLNYNHITVGKPFFVKYGRVQAMDRIAEIIKPDVVCILIGERPGLVTAESMSAYIAYRPYVGIPEAKRSVISNIHKQGTLAVEAGAHIAELIGKMIEQKASGLDLAD